MYYILAFIAFLFFSLGIFLMVSKKKKVIVGTVCLTVGIVFFCFDSSYSNSFISFLTYKKGSEERICKINSTRFLSSLYYSCKLI